MELVHNEKELFVFLSNKQYESLVFEKEAKEELHQLFEESETDSRP